MDVLKARQKAKAAKGGDKSAPETGKPSAGTPAAVPEAPAPSRASAPAEPPAPPPPAPEILKSPAATPPPVPSAKPVLPSGDTPAAPPAPPLPDIFSFAETGEGAAAPSALPDEPVINEEEQFLHSYAAQATRQTNARKYLTFEVGGERYGVLLTDVRETIKPAQITEVPRSPVYLLGLISLRGIMVPVVDLRHRLSLEAPPLTRQSRILICDTERGFAGFVVDRIHKVVDVVEGDIQPPPATLSADEQEAIEGIARYRLGGIQETARTATGAQSSEAPESPEIQQAATVEFFALLRIPVISRIEFAGGSR